MWKLSSQGVNWQLPTSCLPAPNPSFSALLCDTGVGPCKLVSFASLADHWASQIEGPEAALKALSVTRHFTSASGSPFLFTIGAQQPQQRSSICASGHTTSLAATLEPLQWAASMATQPFPRATVFPRCGLWPLTSFVTTGRLTVPVDTTPFPEKPDAQSTGLG